MNEQAPSKEQFYRVVEDVSLGNDEGCKHCGHGTYWTVVSGTGDDEVGIGTSWGYKELADDVCDLMNDAFIAGQERRTEPATPPKERDSEALAWALRAHEDLAKMLADGGGNMLHVRANRALGILFAEVERLEKILYPIGLTPEPPAVQSEWPLLTRIRADLISNTHVYPDDGWLVEDEQHRATLDLLYEAMQALQRSSQPPPAEQPAVEACPGHEYKCVHCCTTSPTLNHDESVMLLQDAEDAKRYRFLRDQRRWYANTPPAPGINIKFEYLIGDDGEALDAAIDRARTTKGRAWLSTF